VWHFSKKQTIVENFSKMCQNFWKLSIIFEKLIQDFLFYHKIIAVLRIFFQRKSFEKLAQKHLSNVTYCHVVGALLPLLPL
jgi:hypothetical protein